ncbi:MAG TPA: zf-HC2 domain-containing protein [Burkholderiaceae bacterium]|nr:zf-HC2 domain-containing protein [Burkholderiaceae bacterium]
MTAKVLPIDGDGHERVQALLPWYASGRLDAAERAAVEAHLAGCARCGADLAWEHKVLAAQQTLDREPGDAERALAQMHRRIAAQQRAVPPGVAQATPKASRWQREPGWLRWVLAVQFAINLVLGTWLVWPLAAGTYHALGSAVHPASANVVVRFRPDATERDIRQVLREVDARLVGGPTASDAYLLSVSPQRQLAAVTALRARPVVVLAESLGPGTPP